MTKTNLPPRLRAMRKASGRTYYYYDAGGGRYLPLGPDYLEAVRRWAEYEGTAAPALVRPTFRQAATRYLKDVLPSKALRTQKDNLAELDNLLKFFDDPPAPLDEIKPVHVRQYLDWRGQQAKTRANREKALFSHIFNCARGWGMTDAQNPCQGVKGFSETGRDVYVGDELYRVLWSCATEPIQDAMDLIYLTGQRPADTLRMAETDIRDGELHIRQGKTKQRLRIRIIGDLAELLQRIAARKARYQVRSLALVVNETGHTMTYAALDNRWEHVRRRAAEQLEASGQAALAKEVLRVQFRDLRAKAGTDKESVEGMGAARDQLGHKNEATTRRYVRHRLGKLVTPTK